MPVFESVCVSKTCGNRGLIVEHFYKHWDDPTEPCEECGERTEKIPSSFASPFMGDMGRKYVDRSLDDGDRQDLHHWVWDRNTPDGKPKPRYIETFQQQKEWCRSNGVALPSELPSNCEASEDGRKLQKATATLRDLKEAEKKQQVAEAKEAS